MKKIFKINILLLIIFCLLSLTSCNSNEKIVQTPINKTTITFSWWGNDNRHIYTMDGIDKFNELYPEINVEYSYGLWSGYETKNKVAMMSKTESDVMQINFSWLKTYSPDGNGYYDLYQLKDYIDLDNFSESVLSYCEINGKLNAIPIAMNSFVVLYNKNIYEEYNLEIPTTFDDYIEQSKVLSENGIYTLGCGKKQIFLSLIAWFEQTTGKHAFNNDGTLNLNIEDIEMILDFYKKLLDTKTIVPIEKFEQTLLKTQTLANTIIWISDAEEYSKAVVSGGADFGFNTLPMQENARLSGWHIKPATLYAISKNTKYPQESAKLINYLLNSKEMTLLQGTEKGVPISKSALSTLESNGYTDTPEFKAMDLIQEQLNDMSIMLPILEDANIYSCFKDNADEYLYGKITKHECAEVIYQQIYNIAN